MRTLVVVVMMIVMRTMMYKMMMIMRRTNMSTGKMRQELLICAQIGQGRGWRNGSAAPHVVHQQWQPY